MKKGFTLVELLGVIIILGILSTFVVINVTKWVSDKSGGIDEYTKESIYLAANNYLQSYDNFEIEKDSYCVKINDLITEGYLDKTLNELNNYNYVYVEYNGISSSYKIQNSSCNLADIIKSKYVSGSENTTLLYKDDTGYYFKGNSTYLNNWVYFNDMLWQIINVDNYNNVTLISKEIVDDIIIADSVWSDATSYEFSNINIWLNNKENGVFYKGLKSNIKYKIVSTDYNVGLYNDVTSIISNQNVGLLDEDLYNKAGGSNSFLNISNSFALGNYSDNSNIRIVGTDGIIINGAITSSYGVRPVITISSFAVSDEYIGTSSNPYRSVL